MFFFQIKIKSLIHLPTTNSQEGRHFHQRTLIVLRIFEITIRVGVLTVYFSFSLKNPRGYVGGKHFFL